MPKVPVIFYQKIIYVQGHDALFVAVRHCQEDTVSELISQPLTKVDNFHKRVSLVYTLQLDESYACIVTLRRMLPCC